MLGLLAILAAGNSCGNSCGGNCGNCGGNCGGNCRCANRNLPAFVPVRGIMESTGALAESVGTLVDEGFDVFSFSVTAPLNILIDPKNVIPVADGLQITRDGLYELSYNMDVQFSRVGEEVVAYVQRNGTADLYALTGIYWLADGALQPAANTARFTLAAGDELRLAVGVFVTPGLLTIAPGATLSVRRVG